MSASRPIDILYVLGTARSGSTAFERFLAMHEGVAAIGEAGRRRAWRTGLEHDRLCSCHSPVAKCEFWSGVRSRAFGEMTPADEAALYDRVARVDRIRNVPRMRARALRSRRFESQLDEAKHLIHGLYQAVADAAPDRLIVDVTKTSSYAHLLATVPGLRVAYVHLVRDSRAVAYSHHHRGWADPNKPEVRRLSTVPFTRAAIQWDVVFATGLLLAATTRGRVLQLRYEDFVAGPANTAKRLRQHLHGLGMPAFGEATDQPECYHSVLGNPLRLRGEFRVEPDTEWRDRMPRRQKAAVTSLTLPFLAMHSRRIGFGRYDAVA